MARAVFAVALLALLVRLTTVQAIIPLVDARICNTMLPSVNQARAAAGVAPPLKCATEMDWAVQYHTNDMVSMGHLTHDGSDGAGISDRIWAATDVMGCKRGQAAENVNAANAPGGAKAHFDAWMNSAGHRQNILTPGITHMGVAVAAGPGGDQYATQVLAQCKT